MVVYANRGMMLESLIEHMNTVYRNQGVALIQKVPTAWLPIRGREGRIVSAKVDKKSGVDYMGVWQHGAIAFEAKSTMNKTRWALSNITEDQLGFLIDHRAVSCYATQFVLLGFVKLKVCYLLDIDYIQEKWNKWQCGGKASIHVSELKRMPSLSLKYPLDYLGVLSSA